MNAAREVVPLPAPKATVAVEQVTAEVAAAWLGANTRNRGLRHARIDQYAEDMKAGRWHPTGETIKFSVSGRLLDGQHRLHAVVQAETVSVPMLVVRGLLDESQAYMDTGAARTAGDALGLRGELHSNVLAAVCRLGYLVDTELLYRDNKAFRVSHAQILGWLDENDDARFAVLRSAQHDMKSIELTASIRAYCYFRLARIDSDAAEQFFSSLGTLTNLPPGSPILALSSRLRRIAQDRQKVSAKSFVNITFRAWNAWREHRHLSNIPLIEHGRLPVPK